MRRMVPRSPALIALVALSQLLAIATVAAKDEAPAPAKAAAEISITSKSTAAVDAFKKGRDFTEDIRTVEAIEQYKKAIELDPDFALAHGYLGSHTPGNEGLASLERGAKLAKDLPEAERTLINALLAERRGDEKQVRSLWMKLTELAPGDWRTHNGLGGLYYAEQKWDQAIAALKKAAELNPGAGSVHNMMGYVYLEMDRDEEAIASFKKYADLSPKEPNPQDSYAEALMAAGRFEEAEAAFRKAAEISPTFYIAWSGVAQTKFLRGDWDGGREALATAKGAATRPIDKLDTDMDVAWSYAAAGDYAKAFEVADQAEKAAVAEKVDVLAAFIPLDRAIMLKETGKYEEALAQIPMGLARAEASKLPGGPMNALRREALGIRVDVESKLGRAEDAKKTVAAIEEEAKKVPDNADARSGLHFARGAEAMARGDAKSAVQHYSQCNDDDYYGRLQLAMAQDKAGDKTAAALTRETLVKANRRGSYYLWVRSEVQEVAEAAAH